MPKAASVAIFSGDHVLLIKRARAPYANYWTLPGGKLEPGETIEACARREIIEELGIALDALTPVCQIPGSAAYMLQVYAALWSGPPPAPGDEIADWQWATLSDAALLMTTPGLCDVLALAVHHLNKS